MKKRKFKKRMALKENVDGIKVLLKKLIKELQIMGIQSITIIKMEKIFHLCVVNTTQKKLKEKYLLQ